MKQFQKRSAHLGADRAQTLSSLNNACSHTGLSFLTPSARIVLLLVADLAIDLEDTLVVGHHPVDHGAGEGVLGVGVNVHLDDAVGNCQCDLFVGGAGAAVHDEVEGAVIQTVVSSDLFLDGAQELRTQLDVTGLVGTVHVTEGQSGDVTTLFAKAQGLNGLDGICGRGVQLLVDFTNDTVFFASPQRRPRSRGRCESQRPAAAGALRSQGSHPTEWRSHPTCGTGTREDDQP